MKIYFAGSIRGGREDAALYAQIIEYLKNYGEVLTEHVGSPEPRSFYDEQLTDAYIHDRDIEWLLSAALVVAEVSVVSAGVGYEIGRAVAAGIPVICLFREGPARRLSAMIAGCKDVHVLYYSTTDGLYAGLSSALDGFSTASAPRQQVEHGRDPEEA